LILYVSEWDLGSRIEEVRARLDELAKAPSFRLVRLDLADRTGMAALFAERRFFQVVHLAAQAGVRRSLVDRRSW
jgi:nucleoside-diphosphate-sugar epimerase